jgi:hypothetical protein
MGVEESTPVKEPAPTFPNITVPEKVTTISLVILLVPEIVAYQIADR